MRTVTYRGRGGRMQTRCMDGDNKFVACSGLPGGLGRSRRGMGMAGLGRYAPRRRLGYDPSWALGAFDFNLPVVGRVNLPTTIQFTFWQGLIGMAVGKVGPGLLGGILDRFVAGGAGYTKFIVGGLTGLTLLSEKYRRNSYLVGFALATFPDLVEPLIDGVMNLVMPKSASNQGIRRRLGQLSPKEAQALAVAERNLLSGARLGQGIPDAGFGGRDVMMASDYYTLTQKAGLNGLNASMVSSPRSIA